MRPDRRHQPVALRQVAEAVRVVDQAQAYHQGHAARSLAERLYPRLREAGAEAGPPRSPDLSDARSVWESQPVTSPAIRETYMWTPTSCTP